MHDPIRHIAERVRALFVRRTTGRYGAACPVAAAPRTPVPASTAAPVRPPRMFDSPFFQDPVFEGERDMVRPYVLLSEQQQELKRQAERRCALARARDGIDVGPRWIHGVEVAG